MDSKSVLDKNFEYTLQIDFQDVKVFDENCSEFSMVIISFHENVWKVPVTTESGEKLLRRQLIRFCCIPSELSGILKGSRIFYKFCTDKESVGIAKQKFSECFVNSVKCRDFKMQKAVKSLKIFDFKKEAGSFTVAISVEKIQELVTAKENGSGQSVKSSENSMITKFLVTKLSSSIKTDIELEAKDTQQVKDSVKKCSPRKRAEKARKKFIEHVKRKSRGKYFYSFGTMRPIRSLYHHQNCFADIEDLVPKNMGWKWNVPLSGTEKHRIKSWCPGAVRNSVRMLMKTFLRPYPCDEGDKFGRKIGLSRGDFNLMQKIPTLKIVKKDGEYYIKMHPLKASKELANCYNPYMQSSPILLKISERDGNCLRNIKRYLKEKGYKLDCLKNCCLCLDNIKSSCKCMTKKERSRLCKELFQISQRLKLENPLNLVDLADVNSESELDLEFYAPPVIAARNLRDVVHTDTQYDKHDFLFNKKPAMKNIEKVLNDKTKKAERVLPRANQKSLPSNTKKSQPSDSNQKNPKPTEPIKAAVSKKPATVLQKNPTQNLKSNPRAKK